MNASNGDDFDLLRERLVFQALLTTRTALHIGAGSGNIEVVDLPVIKTAKGYPFIPGSSIKGVVRSTLESLLCGINKYPLRACNPLANDQTVCGSHAESDRQGQLKRHCAVCRLLGSHLVASHVRFSDAILLNETSAPPIERRDGVAIDRELRIAANKCKYDFEVISAGTSFSMEILVLNPEPWLMGLLLAGLDPIRHGFATIGGFSSRGLGRVDVQWLSLTRVTANQLLQGDSPEKVEDIDSEFSKWRAALRQKVEENSHV